VPVRVCSILRRRLDFGLSLHHASLGLSSNGIQNRPVGTQRAYTSRDIASTHPRNAFRAFITGNVFVIFPNYFQIVTNIDLPAC
jgi:hypothetical protein